MGFEQFAANTRIRGASRQIQGFDEFPGKYKHSRSVPANTGMRGVSRPVKDFEQFPGKYKDLQRAVNRQPGYRAGGM